MGMNIATNPLRSTYYNLDPVAPEQRRTGQRHRTVLLIGRVAHGDGESACLVHDISRNGLMARFTEAPAVGDRLFIEVRGLPQVAATVRWVNDYKAGVEFDEEQDLSGVFRQRGDDGHVPRTPRFAMSATAELRLGETPVTVDLLDISPGGVKLAADIEVEVGQPGRILMPGMIDPVFGTICWIRDGRFGLRFVRPMPLSTLSRVLGC